MAVSAKLSKPTGQKISKVRKQQKKFQFCQSYSYVNRKVWYHQIWIPNNLGFIVSDLIPARGDKGSISFEIQIYEIFSVDIFRVNVNQPLCWIGILNAGAALNISMPSGHSKSLLQACSIEKMSNSLSSRNFSVNHLCIWLFTRICLVCIYICMKKIKYTI